jgi:hypothetical protein
MYRRHRALTHGGDGTGTRNVHNSCCSSSHTRARYQRGLLPPDNGVTGYVYVLTIHSTVCASTLYARAGGN